MVYKKTALLVFLVVVFVSCGTRKTAVTSARKITGTSEAVLDYGMKYLNKPYRYAGKGPNAFDCSGFTSFVFREFGYVLSPSSVGQGRQVPGIGKRKDLLAGDLVFFEGQSHNGEVGHVGIVKEILPNGEFLFLHASTNNGVIISRSTEPYYASRYLRGGRVLPENNRIGGAKKEGKEKSSKTTDKRYHAFVSAKAKEPQLIDVPETQIGTSMAQKSASPEPEKMESDVLAVHSRPADVQFPDSTRNRQDKEETGQIVARAMTLPDTVSVPKPVETTVENGDSIFHEVKPGETLYSISRKYNCSVEQLKQWNPQLRNVLKSGEKLILHP